MKKITYFLLATSSLFFIALYFANAVFANLNIDSQTVAGSESVYLGSFVFAADIEPVRIEALRLYNDILGSDNAISSIELWEKDTRLGSSPLVNRFVSWDNLNVVIPRYDQVTLSVRGNFNESRNMTGVTGKKVRLVIQDSSMSYQYGGDIRVVGLDSGRIFDNAVSFSVNPDMTTVTQHVFDTKLSVDLHESQPMGFQGVALGDEVDLFNFVVSAAGNSGAGNPSEAIVKSITFTVTGGANVTDMALYGDSDGFRSPITMVPVDHVTAPTYGTKQTVFTLNLGGSNAAISFGSNKLYKLKGRVTAETDSNAPSRSLRVSIDTFGTPTTVGDISWYDNGTPGRNPDTQLVTWLDDDLGEPMLRPALPMSFGTSDPGTVFGTTVGTDGCDQGVDCSMTGGGTAPDDFGDISVGGDTGLEGGDLEISSGGGTELDLGADVVDSSDDVVASVGGSGSSGGDFDFSIDIDALAAINPFPDVSLDEIEGVAVVDIYRRNVIRGYPDGLFHGERPVNRVEALKFLLISYYDELPEISYDGRFSDVGTGEWYVPYVSHGLRRNIIKGYPDGSFRPGNTVLMVEFLKMITRTFALEEGLPHSFVDVDDLDWFAPYVGIVEKYNLFPKLTTHLNPAKELTRNEVAVAMFQLLNAREQ